MHSWLSTQNEGWFRIALDNLRIPYDYVSDHVLRATPNLRERWDVILFGPTPGSSQRIVNGLPMTGDPIPWKKTELTPNFANSPDQTDDIRGGMGIEGILHVKRFVEAGGLFITIAGNASIPIDYGLVEGIAIEQTKDLQVRGSVLQALISDKKSPVAYGYPDRLAVYFSQSPVLQLTTPGGFGFGSGFPSGQSAAGARVSGRGTVTDPDIPQGRSYVPAPPPPAPQPGGAPQIPEEMREFLRPFLASPKPRVVLRFAQEKDLLVSGMLAGGAELAGKPVVIDAPSGKGHYLIFANNPMWRQQTQGSFFLLFNAMFHYAHLNVGAPAGPRPGPSGTSVDFSQ